MGEGLCATIPLIFSKYFIAFFALTFFIGITSWEKDTIGKKKMQEERGGRRPGHDPLGRPGHGCGDGGDVVTGEHRP